MQKQITLSLSEAAYNNVKQLARATQRPVEVLIAEAVAQPFPRLYTHPGRPAMEREMAAFETMFPELLVRYGGQFVAVYGGRLVDHDTDPTALVKRVGKKYPDGVVLVKQVVAEPVETLHFRSPHLVRNP